MSQANTGSNAGQTETTTAAATAATQPPAPANEATKDEGQQTGETPNTWDEWLAQQPEDQRALVTRLQDAREAGLKTALNNERDSRKDAETKLRDLAKNAEKGSELQQQLNGMADTLAKEQRRADFYEGASKPELGLADAKGAWLIVNADSETYLDKRGVVNFDLLKQNHPGLFVRPTPTPKANAGSGAGTTAPTGGQINMNDLLRSATGRT